MATEENLKPLKILVFSMGLVLIGGTLLLAAVVMKKMMKEPAVENVVVQAPSTPASCNGGHVDLKGHGEMVDSSISGNVMRVVFEKQTGKSEVVMIDTCSGKVLGTLSLDTDAAVVQE